MVPSLLAHPGAWLGLSINETSDLWMEDIYESRATYLQHEGSVYI